MEIGVAAAGVAAAGLKLLGAHRGGWWRLGGEGLDRVPQPN